MSTRSVAQLFVDLCRQRKNFDVMQTLYSPDIVSVEGDGSQTAGQKQVIDKSKRWAAVNTIHDEQVSGPFFNGDDEFAVHFRWDVTRKDSGERTKLEEVAVYTVKDDHVVRERFFYEGEW